MVAAFGFGYLDNRFRGSEAGIDVMGLPLTPIASGVLIALAAFDILPGSYWLGRVGSAGLSGWAYQQGYNKGA